MPYEKVGPVQLPEIYQPYPLRLNEHLAGARERLDGVAQGWGILTEGVWTIHDLRARL